MKKLSMILAVIVIIAAVTTGCSKKKEGKVTLVLDYTPNTNHTGIYIAQKLGYYEEAGIDLEILQPPEDGAVFLVAAGQAAYGISFQDELGAAFGMEDPLEITTLAAIVNHNTSGFIYHAGAEITSPKDFEGKKVVVWDTPFIREIVKAIVEQYGGDFRQVEMVFNNTASPEMIMQTSDSIMWGFDGWDATNLRVSGVDIGYMDLRKLNQVFDYYTPVIIGNNAYLEENPEQAKAFLAATTKGYEYAVENPEEAAKILVEMVPELDYEVIVASQKLLASEYKGDSARWGEIDKERWDRFNDWMHQKGIIETPIAEGTFTNDFLP